MFRAAFLYFTLVFFAGTILGTVRTLLIAPAIGSLAAVLAEIPLMIGLSWFALKLVLFARPVPPPLPARLGMGALSLIFLLMAEYVLGYLLAGTDLQSFADHLASADGLAGLSGQIIFALLPAIEARRNRA